MPLLRRDFFPIFLSAALLFFLTAAPALLHAQDADLLFEPAPAGSGPKALFTIFYNAESTGEMHPCPT